MIRTAREIFGMSPLRAEWEKIVQVPVFEQGCQAALSVMVEDQPMAGSAAENWDSHSQLVGARKLVEILKTMHLPPNKPQTTKRETLNYNVK